MLRRHFMGFACGAVLALPIAAKAQEGRKLLRIGAVSGQPRNSPYWQSFLQRMGELGYEDGQTFLLISSYRRQSTATRLATGNLLTEKSTSCSHQDPRLP
jgi:hypothetical protein